MNRKLKNQLKKSNKIFKVKMAITVLLILMLGSTWGNTPPTGAKDVSTYKDIDSENLTAAINNSIYSIQLSSSLALNFEADILEEPKIENVDYEELLLAQEEIEISIEDAINTSADGESFTIKAEEAYSVGRNEGKKYAFLTFDDGPSPNITTRVLDTLKKYEVKATFFVVGRIVESYPGITKRIFEDGHALANHTYTHNYKTLYPKKTINVELFAEEMKKTQEAVRQATEREIFMRVVRFPGGSFEGWKNPMKEEIINNGMHYIDWNVENGDGLKQNISVNEQLDKIKKHISWAENANKNVVILMHDAPAKRTTADALPKIIEYIKSKGYEFKTLK